MDRTAKQITDLCRHERHKASKQYVKQMGAAEKGRERTAKSKPRDCGGRKGREHSKALGKTKLDHPFVKSKGEGDHREHHVDRSDECGFG